MRIKKWAGNAKKRAILKQTSATNLKRVELGKLQAEGKEDEYARTIMEENQENFAKMQAGHEGERQRLEENLKQKLLARNMAKKSTEESSNRGSSDSEDSEHGYLSPQNTGSVLDMEEASYSQVSLLCVAHSDLLHSQGLT